MSTVEQIEAAIQQLPREEFFRLHEWIRDRFDDEWDKQIEEDALSGRLDPVAQAALVEHRAGKVDATEVIRKTFGSQRETTVFERVRQLNAELDRLGIERPQDDSLVRKTFGRGKIKAEKSV